jgi:hypothetical protein
VSRDIGCRIVSWRQIQRLSRDLAFRIRDDGVNPDIIVAVGRGGWIPGRLLSEYLGNLNLTAIKVEHYKGTQKHRRLRYPLRAYTSCIWVSRFFGAWIRPPRDAVNTSM